jgi:DNA-directed RNA polymerase II subunit RPB2
MEVGIRGEEARELAETILKKYFTTQGYPYTRHHIESYDQFVSQDIPAIIKASNPLILLHGAIGETGQYMYKAEIFVGGLEGNRLFIGTPTISLRDSQEIRVLLPNEARLRNLTYASSVEADIVIRLTYSSVTTGRTITQREVILDPALDPTLFGYLAKFPIFRLPIMLHSRYCLLHGKPAPFIKEAGECQYDFGGYFIVDGSEKVLITHQEQAFNVLNISLQERDPKIAIFSSISCLNPTTKRVKRVAFAFYKKEQTLLMSLPLIRKPVPLFVVFRALGIQSDEDILRMIFPDPDATETKIMQPLLHESILEAHPFFDTYSAIQYIKVLTKGFSEAHVLDILHNQVFIHVENSPKARAAFLAECVRRILRVKAGIDAPSDRDDIRNQRCLTSGILIRTLFQGLYTNWLKAVRLTLDKERNFNEGIYDGDKYQNLFLQGTLNKMFNAGMMTEGLMRAFKGKWSSGSGAGVGDEKTGVIQALSRLSYMDFMSHCRRVVLDFDTGMKLAGPRRLHTSQYGYFCTSETPGGGSIGITKNLSMLTSISVATDPGPIIKWLYSRGEVMTCDQMTPAMLIVSVPVFVNAGIIGYTLRPIALRDVLKVLKWTGCLPPSSSVGFSIRDRRVFLFVDEGRPGRPLIHLGPRGSLPVDALRAATTWRNLVMGVLPITSTRGLFQGGFVDPFAAELNPSLESYVQRLAPDAGVIEYVDPYEMNETFVANFPENIQKDSTHLEIHPSTIVGLLTSMIPYANHNQSPRNQLSCSQSKQGLSVYSTAFQNRFDNQVHVLCYGQAPLVRTLYYDYLADGQMGYGHNIILAMGSFTGYNQDDGILFNADSFARGMFRSTFYRSYEAFEEDDPMTHGKTRIGNPANVPGWLQLKPGIDYSKLDGRGIVRIGEYVDETSVLVGMYLQSETGDMRDASVTAQVWTRGRVEDVSVTVNNSGLAMVKIRVVQERVPELGDKFSNRHGQKGTIGMLLRGYDMPRTSEGIPVDMIMNPHAIPSRMTVAQLIEALVGKAAPPLGTVGNGTLFMNDGNPVEAIGGVLRDVLGMEPFGEELMYDGMSGQLIPTQMFIGNVYTMRLKHMPEDKWNARGEGKREQRTHQPTGGRGAQGGLRIGEMERDAILGHGISGFLQESIMKRADGYTTIVCNGCGSIPIYNERQGLTICPSCDGPVKYIGSTASNLEILPPLKRSVATFSKINIPYAFKLLDQEMNGYLNMGMRVLTEADVKHFRGPPLGELAADEAERLLSTVLPEKILLATEVPAMIVPEEQPEIGPENLAALGLSAEEEEEKDALVQEAPVLVSTPNTVNIQLPPGMNVAQQQVAAEEFDEGADAIPFSSEAPMALQQPQQQFQQQPQQNQQQPQQFQQQNQQPQQQFQQQGGGGNSVNVQTSSQPVLVIPMNVGQAAPTEIIQPPMRGAPGTIAVDTSDRALNSMGLPSNQQRPQRGGSPNARRPSSGGGVRSGGGTPVVTVQRQGSSAPSNSNSNVKVQVTKQG